MSMLSQGSIPMELDHAALKARHRNEREGYSPALSLRTHRALSWLARAEREGDDHDARFLFLWISFNAAYANEIHDRKAFTEQAVLRNFLAMLVDLDRDKLLYSILWEEFPGAVRVLIDNRYVFGPFWDAQAGRIPADAWLRPFEDNKAWAHRAMGAMDTAGVLAVVFDRLYTLRNQLVHGGATWNSSVNRNQLRDAVQILGRLVPAMLHLMMEHSGRVWGEPSFPVVDRG